MMKKLIALFLMSLVTVLLAGCVDTKEEAEVEFVEYVDKSEDEKYLVFVSHDLEKYFKLSLTKYEFTHKLEDLKKLDTIEVHEDRYIFIDTVITKYKTKDGRELYEVKY